MVWSVWLGVVLGTLVAGVGSVWLAAALSFGVLRRYTQHMLSLAAGALLATAFLHLLPEAFESHVGAHELFMVFLLGLVLFFLLSKAHIWHHGHEHGHGDHHDHGHHHHAHAAHAHQQPSHHTHPPTGAWSVLVGDSVHCFGDGILIASAFMADTRLGVLAALAVLAHEVPHHMGDLAVVAQDQVPSPPGDARRRALIKVTLAGGTTLVGGLAGLLMLGQLQDYLPYFLVMASSSFVYVALADLIPQLQKRMSGQETAAQLLWLALGIGLVWACFAISHSLGHAH
jgi:zinc and cadmium transporter